MLLSVILAALEFGGLVNEQGVLLVIRGEFAVGWCLGGSASSGGSARNAPSSGQFTIFSGSWAGFVSHMCSWAEQCCPLVPSRSDGVKGGGTPSSHTLGLRIVFPLRIVQL